MEQEAPQTLVEIPDNFSSTISDFINDLNLTFPEFKSQWTQWTNAEEQQTKDLYLYCLGIYPQRFFDILNQNDEIFKKDSSINTCFLPNVEFKDLYNCEGVTKNTQESIWKYLQLILFVLVGNMKDKMDFGEAMKMFDDLEKGDLESKLQDAMNNIHEFFSNVDEKEGEKESSESTFQEKEGQEGDQERPGPNIPEPSQLHDHLQGLFEGKIGKFAKELAADLGDDLQGTLGLNFDDPNSSKDVLKKLLSNPQQITGLVKTVGEKLTAKMSSGELSQQDLLKEAGGMMRKMKDLGGNGDLGGMFKKMASSLGVNMPKGAQFNTNAFAQMEKQMQQKEGVRQRAEDKKLEKEAATIIQQQEYEKRKVEYDKFMEENPNIFNTEDPNSLIYRLEGEVQEKSKIKPPSSNKKKNKKKKGKK